MGGRRGAAAAGGPRRRAVRVGGGERDGPAGTDALAAALPDAAPPADLADGPPLALWYFARHPDASRQVFLRHEPPAGDVWRFAAARANLPLPDDDTLARRYRAALAALGTPAVWAEVFRVGDVLCLLGRAESRLRYRPALAADGAVDYEAFRPARRVFVQYHPADGAVLVCGPLSPAETDRFLLALAAVLGSPVALRPDALALDRLKEPFAGPPDAADMEAVRVRALHLCYPAADGGRVLKLETRATDADDALDELLRAHVRPDGLAALRVCHAELQVHLREPFGPRPVRLKLWPDRATILQPDASTRVLRCLARWGLLA